MMTAPFKEAASDNKHRRRTKNRKPTQLELPYKCGRGGRRPGAGRKKGPNPKVVHRPRSRVSRHHPTHLTLRLKKGLPDLRDPRVFALVVQPALGQAKKHLGMRIVHYCVLYNHLHLIVESDGRPALSRGVKGLSVRLARALNKLTGRKGPVFADRYHDHVLKTPREVRHALCYVIQNFRRHMAQQQAAPPMPKEMADPYSSGPTFDGFKTRPCNWTRDGPGLSVPARTWLLAKGWRRHGLIATDELPGLRIRRPSARS